MTKLAVDPTGTASNRPQTPDLLEFLRATETPPRFLALPLMASNPPTPLRLRVYLSSASTGVPAYGRDRPPLLVSDLGWSQEEAAATRARLAAFEEDWDAPGMDAYDAL
jgi:hypothetical protein